MPTPDDKVNLDNAPPVALVFLKGGVFGGIQRKWANYLQWYNGFWEACNAERTPRENPYGDGETQANHVNARNSQLHWVCVVPSKDEQNMREWFRGIEISFEFVDVGTNKEPSILQWRRLIRKYSPVNVLDFRGLKAYRLMLTAWWLGVPSRCLAVVQETYSYGKKVNPWLRIKWHRWITHRTATKIHTISPTAGKMYYPKRWAKGEVQTYRQPFNMSAFSPAESAQQKKQLRLKWGLDPEKTYIGYTGRRVSVKNISLILEAVGMLASERSNLGLMMAGKNIDKPAFRKRIEREAPGVDVHLYNHVDDVAEFLRCLDYFIFPSLHEGQPFSLLEAMSCGIPVIASDIPAHRYMTPSDFHSKLFDPHQPMQAAEILRNLMDGKVDREAYIHLDWMNEQYDVNTNYRLISAVFGAPVPS
jgi:glycosyltransferase involved in cell wall biosynthesis